MTALRTAIAVLARRREFALVGVNRTLTIFPFFHSLCFSQAKASERHRVYTKTMGSASRTGWAATAAVVFVAAVAGLARGQTAVENQQRALDAFAAQLSKDFDSPCTAPDIATCTSPCHGTNCETFDLTLDSLRNVNSLFVSCGNESSRRSEISFRQNILSKMPTEVGLLTMATRLDVFSNRLAEIPTEIGNMAALVSLFGKLRRSVMLGSYRLAALIPIV